MAVIYIVQGKIHVTLLAGSVKNRIPTQKITGNTINEMMNTHFIENLKSDANLFKRIFSSSLFTFIIFPSKDRNANSWAVNCKIKFVKPRSANMESEAMLMNENQKPCTCVFKKRGIKIKINGLEINRNKLFIVVCSRSLSENNLITCIQINGLFLLMHQRLLLKGNSPRFPAEYPSSSIMRVLHDLVRTFGLPPQKSSFHSDTDPSENQPGDQ